VTRNTHQCAISCVVWFPFDTGIFISSGFDKCIKVWDTNKMLPVYDFKMERKVNGQAMSSCATFHSLIAAATDDPNVKLCDLQSGTAVHILKVLAFSTSSGLHVISTTSYRPGITKFAASTA
jgi:DNA excision repair protein ERCC-8